MLEEGDRLLWTLAARWTAFAWRHARAAGDPTEQADLHQAALVGLWEAALRFDPASGRYSTFAGWYVQRALGDPDARAPAVQIPGQERWRLRRYLTERERGVSITAAAATLGTTPAHLRTLHAAALSCGEGQAPVDDDPAEPWGGAAEAASEDEVPDLIERRHLTEIVQEEVGALPVQQRTLIEWAYGLTDGLHGDGLTYAQMSQRSRRSAGWVKATLSKGRAALASALDWRLTAMDVSERLAAGTATAEDRAWLATTDAARSAKLLPERHVPIARAVLRLARRRGVYGVRRAVATDDGAEKHSPVNAAPSGQTTGEAARSATARVATSNTSTARYVSA